LLVGRDKLFDVVVVEGTGVVLATASNLIAAEHDTHGHGPPSFLASTDLSLSAGPSFSPNELVKCSSVSWGRPVPSMDCSRKFWKITEIKTILASRF
jgi:hypothetical protein